MCVFDRSKRWRQPDHCVVVRTGVHAEPVQLVGAGQPPRPRHRWRWRRRRTPSDATHEPDPDKSSARPYTDLLHGRPDEPHFGCLLPAPTDASAVLHVVLITPGRSTSLRRLFGILFYPDDATHNPQPATFTCIIYVALCTYISVVRIKKKKK